MGGDGAFFLLLDEPEVYGLPPDPVVTTRDLPSMWRHAGAAAATIAAIAAAAFAAGTAGRTARTLARRPAMTATGVAAGARGGGGKRRASSRWCRPPSSPPTTAGRCSTRRCGRRGTSPGYLFLGGLAGGSSLLAAGADLTGRPELGRAAKAGAFAAGLLSLAALVHDLGRPARFLNMMRVFKVTSPMSVGSWLLAGYVPACRGGRRRRVTGRMPRLGAAATAGAALLGPAVASYTAALISDTAVPAWHDGYREMPFVFTGSAAMAAGGLGLLAAPAGESGPARNLALAGQAMEMLAFDRMNRRMGMTAEPYHRAAAARTSESARSLAPSARRGRPWRGLPRCRRAGPRRIAAAVSGAALVGASAATRWGIFHAGMASARDPKYTVVPQRERLRERARAAASGGTPPPAAVPPA